MSQPLVGQSSPNFGTIKVTTCRFKSYFRFFVARFVLNLLKIFFALVIFLHKWFH